MLGPAQQRQHRLGQPPGAEQVHLEYLVCLRQVVITGWGVIAIYAGVVDQDVEPTGVIRYSLGEKLHAAGIGNVQLDLVAFRPAGPREDQEVLLITKLPRDLKADPAIRAADQRDRLRTQILWRWSSFLPITMRWISEVPSPIRSSGASR